MLLLVDMQVTDDNTISFPDEYRCLPDDSEDGRYEVEASNSG